MSCQQVHPQYPILADPGDEQIALAQTPTSCRFYRDPPRGDNPIGPSTCDQIWISAGEPRSDCHVHFNPECLTYNPTGGQCRCAPTMSCDADPQFWSDLYASDITSNDCLSKFQTLLDSPFGIALARGFQGSEAKILINFLDRVLGQSSLNDEHRQRCLRLLYKICKAQKVLPTSYILRSESVKVGRFRDRGGFAEVSDGEHMGRTVAIKDLRTNQGAFDKIFRRFCREIICWKYLRHPNILPLVGVSMSTELYYFQIISEWMPNGNLVQYTRVHPEANRLQLLSEVASGTTYLHELMIVHGDLKGANIFVDNIGTARIGDFGFTTVSDLSTRFFSDSVDSIGGTLPWMSPELLGSACPGSKVHPTLESDCYALGMVIYEILTGHPPFHGLSPLQIMLALATDKRPRKPLGAKSLGLSDRLWELVQSCWSRSASDRPTAQSLLDHLSRASLTWVPRTVSDPNTGPDSPNSPYISTSNT